ncbi:MAG TPA: hypothetical protein VF529_12315 [Solirubrobacteraceae bacterium]|jgi:hypothetical protein
MRRASTAPYSGDPPTRLCSIAQQDHAQDVLAVDAGVEVDDVDRLVELGRHRQRRTRPPVLDDHDEPARRQPPRPAGHRELAQRPRPRLGEVDERERAARHRDVEVGVDLRKDALGAARVRRHRDAHPRRADLERAEVLRCAGGGARRQRQEEEGGDGERT